VVSEQFDRYIYTVQRNFIILPKGGNEKIRITTKVKVCHLFIWWYSNF